MKFIHTKEIPIETIHGSSLQVNRIIAVGQSKTRLQTFNRATLPPGKTMAPHRHDDCEEVFYFLSGRGEVVINDTIVSVSNDDVVIAEPGEEHEIRNSSSENLIYLSVRIML